MLLSATSPAAYSLSPSAKSFHTRTIAIQRAKPISIKPTIYSGLSFRKRMAKRNIKIGPMIQFRNSERLTTFKFVNTFPKCSYRTFASGGYIIVISPIAMSRFVVPSWKWLMKTSIGKKMPSAIPRAIARKIQSVRYRSKKPSCFWLLMNFRRTCGY